MASHKKMNAVTQQVCLNVVLWVNYIQSVINWLFLWRESLQFSTTWMPHLLS